MAFPAEILRAGISIANSLTKGVQATVTLERWTGQDAYGTETYGSSTSVRAVVDLTRRQRMSASGRLVTVVAMLTILDQIDQIDPKDRITLPNGVIGPILSGPDAVVDPGDNEGFIQEVAIGEPGA